MKVKDGVSMEITLRPHLRKQDIRGQGERIGKVQIPKAWGEGSIGEKSVLVGSPGKVTSGCSKIAQALQPELRTSSKGQPVWGKRHTLPSGRPKENDSDNSKSQASLNKREFSNSSLQAPLTPSVLLGHNQKSVALVLQMLISLNSC